MRYGTLLTSLAAASLSAGLTWVVITLVTPAPAPDAAPSLPPPAEAVRKGQARGVTVPELDQGYLEQVVRGAVSEALNDARPDEDAPASATSVPPPPSPEVAAAVEEADLLVDELIAKGRLDAGDSLDVMHSLETLPSREARRVVARLAHAVNTRQIERPDGPLLAP